MAIKYFCISVQYILCELVRTVTTCTDNLDFSAKVYPCIPRNSQLSGVYRGIYYRLVSLVVMVHIDHYFSYNIGIFFQGPQKEKIP